jgi:hypothetical protein
LARLEIKKKRLKTNIAQNIENPRNDFKSELQPKILENAKYIIKNKDLIAEP